MIILYLNVAFPSVILNVCSKEMEEMLSYQTECNWLKKQHLFFFIPA